MTNGTFTDSAFPFTNLNDGRVYTKYRSEIPGGKKIWTDPGFHPDELDLHNGDLIGDPAWSGPVFIVEGEPKANRLVFFDMIGVSFAGSSSQRRFHPKALERLRGQDVCLWPDNDKPGLEYDAALIEAVRSVAPKSLRLLEPVSLSEGADVVDLLAGLDIEDAKKAKALVQAYVDTAEEIVISEPPGPTPVEVSEERLILTSLRDGLATPEPPTEWVVDGLLNQGGTSCLSGPFKGGKSTLYRIMCVAAAAGIPFLGRDTRPCRVGYISLEEDRAGVKEHFRLLSEQVEDDSILDRIFYRVGDEWLPSKLDEKIDLIHEVITGQNLQLLVIGPLQDLFAFRNINDYSEVKPALRGFTNKVARTTGCHITFDHHNNKYGTGRAAFLGSVAIGGGVDQLLTLTVVEDDNGQVNGRGLTTWQRYGESMTNLLGLDFVPNRIHTGLGPPPERLRDQAGLQQMAVKITALCQTWTDARTIEAEIGGNKERRIAATNWAVDQGMLARQVKKGRGGGYEYLDAQRLDDTPRTGSRTGSPEDE